MKLLNIILFLILFSFSVTADEEKIKNSLKNILPEGSKIESIKKSNIPGLYTVYYGDLEPIYVSEDGGFFIYGDIYKINNNSITNITNLDIDKRRSVILKDLQSYELISFKAKKEQYSVVVFTDVDCSYCRKLHKEIEDYNDIGITINYAAFPRSGIGSEAFSKMVGAWCSSDKKSSLTKLKNDKDIVISFCEDQPVSKHFVIGKQLGVTGTPAIFSFDGKLFPGYLSAEELLIKLKS